MFTLNVKSKASKNFLQVWSKQPHFGRFQDLRLKGVKKLLLCGALEVISNVMRSINPRFTYLLTYIRHINVS